MTSRKDIKRYDIPGASYDPNRQYPLTYYYNTSTYGGDVLNPDDISKKPLGGLFAGLSAGNLGNTLGNFSNKLGDFGLQGIRDYGRNLNESYYEATGGRKLWNKGTGIDRLGNLANAAGILMQGGNAIKGLYDNSQQESDLNELLSDIEGSAYANPLANYYLTSDQRQLLRDVKKDRVDTADFTDAISGTVKGIPKALLSVLGGYLTGGTAGAAIQGFGSLINSGIEGYGSANEAQDAKLQALYEALLSAEADYNSMKRPNLKGAGLSTRNYNSLY